MIGANQIIEKKKEFLLPSSHRNHFYANAPQIVKGSMQFLYDDQGKEYLDFFAGVSVQVLKQMKGQCYLHVYIQEKMSLSR